MGFFRGKGASGGSLGRAAGRGPVNEPNRTTMAVPPPVAAIAPGGASGPVFPHFGSFYATLPLAQASPQDFTTSPEVLRYARPRYANTAGRDTYQAPTAVSWTENRAVGPAAGGGAVSPIPVSIKRYDVGTFYQWFRSQTQRYPNAGEGTPRPYVQHGQIALSRRASAAQAQMRPYYQNRATQLPSTISYGSTTNAVLAPFQSGGSVFA